MDIDGLEGARVAEMIYRRRVASSPLALIFKNGTLSWKFKFAAVKFTAANFYK